MIKDGADPFLKNNHGHSTFDIVNQNADGELKKASLTKLLLESVSHQEATNTLMTADVLHLHDDTVGLTHEPVAHKAMMASYSNEVVTTLNLIDTVSLAAPIQTPVIDNAHSSFSYDSYMPHFIMQWLGLETSSTHSGETG